MKKKILFVLPTLHSGGAENFALRFIKYNQTQFDFHVLSVNLQKGDLFNQFFELGIQIHYFQLGYFNPIKMIEFYKFLNKNNYDTICGFNGNFDGLPITIAKYAGVKNRISFYRRSTNAFNKNPLKSFYNNFVNYLVRKNTTFVLSNSQFALKNFHNKYYLKNPKYKVIPNGLDEKAFDTILSKKEARIELNLPLDSFIIGHVGRLDPAKNHQTIFEVAKKLWKKHDHILFLFCGKGTDSHDFSNQLYRFGIQNISVVLGIREDLAIIYRAMDVFYFPSITEGQPNALIEAMISGLPIVTSNIPPILEALPPKAHQLTLPPYDTALAVDLLNDLYIGKVVISNFVFKEWAKSNFDVKTNFNIFKDLL